MQPLRLLTIAVLFGAIHAPSGRLHTVAWSVFARAHPDPQFYAPGGVAAGVDGNIYAVDSGNNRVVKLSRDGRVLAAWGHFGKAWGEFNTPSAIATDPARNVYVVDTRNDRVVKMLASGKTGAVWTFRQVTGEGADAYVRDISTGGRGNVFVLTSTHITKLSPQGKLLARWKIGGEVSDGVADAGRALAVDRHGNIHLWMEQSTLEPDCGKYCAYDEVFHLVTLAPNGREIASRKSYSCVSSVFTDCPASTPMAVDRGGNVFVGGRDWTTIKVFRANGLISTWRLRLDRYSYYGGLGGLAADSTGRIYVTNPSAGSVHVLSPGGKDLAMWGITPSNGPEGLLFPEGVGVDGRGRVYVGDRRAQAYNASGTLIGGLKGCASARGPVAVDNRGDLYYAAQTRRVRRCIDVP